MADDKQEETQINTADEPQGDAAESTDAGKGGGLKKYLLFGGIGLALVVLTAITMLVLLGGEKTSEEPSEQPEVEQVAHSESASEPASHTTDEVEELAEAGESDVPVVDEDLDFMIDEADESVLEKIESSLAFLDYEPESGDMPEEDEVEASGMSKEDSVEAVDWLTKEKGLIARRQEELDKKERELVLLDKKVTQKVLVIEQAESSRISQLAKLYDGMDSRAVAQLMASLDDNTVVAIIPRMKQKNASSLLQLLPPQRAARLSKKMITIAEN